MSDYGCCTMSICVHEDDYESCDDCPFYDKNFFRENKLIEEIDMDEILKYGVPYNKALESGRATTSEVFHIKADQINLAVECMLCQFAEPKKTREKCAVVKELGFCITELTGGWKNV